MTGFTWHQADIAHQDTGPRRAGLPGTPSPLRWFPAWLTADYLIDRTRYLAEKDAAG